MKLKEREAQRVNILNIPNLLSLTRFILLPFLLRELYLKHLISSLIILFFIFATDFFDGYIARKYGIVTSVGKIMDHLVDKLLHLFLTLILYLKWELPLWFLCFVLIREGGALIVGGFLYLFKKMVVQSNDLGRVGAVFLGASYLSYLLNISFKEYLLYLTALVLLAASINYGRIYLLRGGEAK